MKKSELKALIKEVVQENFAVNHSMTQMVDKQERRKKEAHYKSKLEQYHQAAKGHWPEQDEYESDVISLGKNLGYSDSDIHQDLNRYTKPEDEPVMNNFIFESKLKALIREVIEEMGDNNGLGFKVYDPVGNEELKIEKGWEDACDECGDSDGETYYVPSWGGHRCYGCLTHELKKFGYRVEKI